MGFELVKREAMKFSPDDVTPIMNAVSQYHAPSITKVLMIIWLTIICEYSTCIIYTTYGVYTCSGWIQHS